MGRRRKTKEERELYGDPGHRTKAELARPELPITRDIGPCPSFIKGVAAEEWARVVGELERNGLLTIMDRGPLEAYCLAYARWRKVEKELNSDGELINGKRISPRFILVQRCVDQMHGLAVKLGRSRPIVPLGGPKKDDDDGFFDGKKKDAPTAP